MSRNSNEQNSLEIEHEKLPAMIKANDIEALKSLFKMALATRDFEITQLVQRNNFFMIFQGVLFGGVMQSSHTKPLVSFLVCLVGWICCFNISSCNG